MVKIILQLDIGQVHYSPTLRIKVILHFGAGMFLDPLPRRTLHKLVVVILPQKDMENQRLSKTSK
jgi:hypothetical protein